MNQYIITEEQLQAFSWALGGLSKNNRLLKEIRSHPYNPQAEREKVLDEVKAKTELKKVYHVYDDHLRGLTFYVKLDDIYKVIEELRQEGTVEK